MLWLYRFEESNMEQTFSSERQTSTNHELFPTKEKSYIVSVMGSIRRGFEKCSREIRGLKKLLNLQSASDQPTTASGSGKKVLDPQGPFLQQWNKYFALAWVIAVSLDPLFFYIPVISGKEKCLDLDDKLKIIACVLRSVIDVFYILRMIFQFRTGFVAPSSRVYGRGELIEDPYAIAKRYLSSYFIIDLFAVLPLLQVVVFIISPKVKGPLSRVTKDMLKCVIFGQYVPRLVRIYPLYKEITRTSGLFTETAWVVAAFNLLLYMLASHVVGAFWYLLSIESQERCWHDACTIKKIDVDSLYCGANGIGGRDFLSDSCPLLDPNAIKSPTDFNFFGIFLDALRFQVIEMRDFRAKNIFYCFWWGLRNLSSLGKGLMTSTFHWGDSLCRVYLHPRIVSVFFAHWKHAAKVLQNLFPVNTQKYLQSITVRIEEMRVKRRDAEQWMSHRMLPEDLREQVRRYEQYRWQETRGVEEESLIGNLPKDLRRNIKRHLCWGLLKRVPMFEKMDRQLLDGMCDRLKPVLYTEKSSIVREGDPVDEMLFVMRDTLLTMTTNGGRTGFFNSDHLNAGDFCGEELLTWALDPNSSSSLPTSTRTAQALTDVVAFALMADDLRFVASQFRQLSKVIQTEFHAIVSPQAFNSFTAHLYVFHSYVQDTCHSLIVSESMSEDEAAAVALVTVLPLGKWLRPISLGIWSVMMGWNYSTMFTISNYYAGVYDFDYCAHNGFRFCSQQWRTWAACFIQAAWRRYCKKKLEKSLQEEEDRLQDALAKEVGTSPSLGATIYAARFAANALRSLRRNQRRSTKLPQKLPPLLLQKPTEPDFSAEGC
ncbi:hypothetical protein RJ639_041616 [Escallonia herrerae]|uniref:Cyclic nucleotide-binding domain-containing protein n=1 Tax=Escallonia herrerae TaxID=1293975 RepID=A0AA89BBH0_9ASTE|nr:hypothetical protein RJ639_041616 [Escallonia herrerae]